MQGRIEYEQKTLVLFMSQRSLVSLMQQEAIELGVRHSYAAGPLQRELIERVDCYVWIKMGDQFVPDDIVAQNLIGWRIEEDMPRHQRWYRGTAVGWRDTVTQGINVDRSSIGNAIYVLLGMSTRG
jgi:hypothetical protein